MEVLFNYLRDVLYDPEKAVLNIDDLPDDYRVFGSGLLYFTECVMETKALAHALSKGDLTGKLPSRGNEIAAPLKSLHASLKHLTWQAQQIAKGDYSQRIAFMGDFSNAFNTMVEQLAERQKKLECEINQIQKKSKSLEQGNLLLSALMQYVPQQIIVIDKNTRKILLMNDIAKNEVNNDSGYLDNLIKTISGRETANDGQEFEVIYLQGGHVRYFMIRTYSLEWKNTNAEVYTISDISATKSKIEELENHAYRDNITQLYNRAFGMLTLDSWLHEKRRFSLVFADLDGLKYINDEFGHKEGDNYIFNAAKYLKTFSAVSYAERTAANDNSKKDITKTDTVVCRIGGDEFMVLASDINYDEAFTAMKKIYDNFLNDESLKKKKYPYSFSFGIAAVEKNNNLSASEILSIADEKMYEDKRARKKERKN
ncbi:MAG: diguanylate cyclase [Treponema sp.]|nr:diguanylate cyclase [Treponema sp.]